MIGFLRREKLRKNEVKRRKKAGKMGIEIWGRVEGKTNYYNREIEEIIGSVSLLFRETKREKNEKEKREK